MSTFNTLWKGTSNDLMLLMMLLLATRRSINVLYCNVLLWNVKRGLLKGFYSFTVARSLPSITNTRCSCTYFNDGPETNRIGSGGGRGVSSSSSSSSSSSNGSRVRFSLPACCNGTFHFQIHLVHSLQTTITTDMISTYFIRCSDGCCCSVGFLYRVCYGCCNINNNSITNSPNTFTTNYYYYRYYMALTYFIRCSDGCCCCSVGFLYWGLVRCLEVFYSVLAATGKSNL